MLNEVPFPERRRTSAHGFHIALATIFVLASLLFGRDAFAYHRNLTVHFDALVPRHEHGQLHVDYAIDHDDWHAVQGAGIRPRLNLYARERGTGFSYVYSMELVADRGTVVFPAFATPRHLREVEFRLSGFTQSARIDRMSVGSECDTRVRVAVRRPARRQERGASHDVAGIIAACSEELHSSSELSACVAKASHLRSAATQTIRACGEATTWSDDMLGCLDQAVAIRRDPASTVAACSESTYFSDDFRACLRESSRFHVSAAPSIRACRAAAGWSDEFEACVRTAAELGRGAERVVRACDEATHWSDDFRHCLEAGRRT